jgi:hypothetical protein
MSTSAVSVESVLGDKVAEVVKVPPGQVVTRSLSDTLTFGGELIYRSRDDNRGVLIISLGERRRQKGTLPSLLSPVSTSTSAFGHFKEYSPRTHSYTYSTVPLLLNLSHSVVP